MKKLTASEAKDYARERFKRLPELYAQWNFLHSSYIIKALKELTLQETVKDKLQALAWVHDIGKIEGDEHHPEKGLKILDNEFILDEVDKDCILNHGSGSKPTTPEGKLFRNADGLSLFYPEMILFMTHWEAKEKSTFEQIKEKMKKQYEKYSLAYKDNPRALKLLREKYEAILEDK